MLQLVSIWIDIDSVQWTMTTYARSFLLGLMYCMYKTASQPWHNTLYNLHICRPHTGGEQRAGKHLIKPISSVFSKHYNAVKFICVNKQAGVNFNNLKLLTVPENKILHRIIKVVREVFYLLCVCGIYYFQLEHYLISPPCMWAEIIFWR